MAVNQTTALIDLAREAKAWRAVELAGHDIVTPEWWDATRRLRDVADRTPLEGFDVDNETPTGEHGADSLTGGV